MFNVEELKVGHFIKFVGSEVPDGRVGKFYRITSLEAFNYATGDSNTTEFTSVATGASSGFQVVDRLEPDDDPDHAYYVEWGVKDGMRYKFKLPNGVNRIGIDLIKDVGYVDNLRSDYLDPSPRYAFWTLPDIFPAFNADNITPQACTPKVYFRGWIFAIVKVPENSDVYGRLVNFERGLGGQAFTNVVLGGVT